MFLGSQKEMQAVLRDGVAPALPTQEYLQQPGLPPEALIAFRDCPAKCYHQYLSPHPLHPTRTKSELKQLLAVALLGGYEPGLPEAEGVALHTSEWMGIPKAERGILREARDALFERSEWAASDLLLPDEMVSLPTLTWQEPITGLECKAQPHCISLMPDGDVQLLTFIHLNRASMAFALNALEFDKYLITCMAWQAMAIRLLFDLRTWPHCLLVVQEPRAPYIAEPYTVRPERIDAGHRANMGTLTQLALCMESGQWPGYNQSTITEI